MNDRTRPGLSQHPLPPVKLPAPTVPDVDGTKDEQAVLLKDGAAPPPLAFDVAAVRPPAFDVAVLPPDDDALEDDPPDDCAGVSPPPPACGDEESVCVGTTSGSVPQDDDVVTPPVALGETEHGPCGMNAGLVSPWPPEGVEPGVALSDSGPPGVVLADLLP